MPHRHFLIHKPHGYLSQFIYEKKRHKKLLGELYDFPEGTMASRPQGGFVLWIELPEKINTMELYEKTIVRKISFAPGRIFTLQNQYHHCMRLNYGLVWDDKLDARLKMLGDLAKKEL